MQIRLPDIKNISDNSSLLGTGPLSKILQAVKGEAKGFT